MDWDGYMKHWKPSARFIEVSHRGIVLLLVAAVVSAAAHAASMPQRTASGRAVCSAFIAVPSCCRIYCTFL